jgi:hypothetical protein
VEFLGPDGGMQERSKCVGFIDELRLYLRTAGLVAAVEGYPRIEGALFCIGVILCLDQA